MKRTFAHLTALLLAHLAALQANDPFTLNLWTQQPV